MKWNSATATATALYNASKESNPEAIPAGEYFAKITASEAYTFENPEDETKPDKYGALIEVTITRGQQKGKKLSESPQCIHPLWFFRDLTEEQCPSVSLQFWIRRQRCQQPWQ